MLLGVVGCCGRSSVGKQKGSFIGECEIGFVKAVENGGKDESLGDFCNGFWCT